MEHDRIWTTIVAASALLGACSSRGQQWPDHLGTNVEQSVVHRTSSGADDIWPPDTAHNLFYCVASAANWGGTDGIQRRAFVRTLMDMSTRLWEHEANVNFIELDFGDNNTTCEGIVQSTIYAVKAGPGSGGDGQFPSNATHYFILGTDLFATDSYLQNQPQDQMPFITHETGHMLGLDHEQGHRNAAGQIDWVDPVPRTGTCTHVPTSVRSTSGSPDYCSVMTSVSPECGITFEWIDGDTPVGSQLWNCSSYRTRVVSVKDGAGLRSLYGPPPHWQYLLPIQALHL